MMKKLFLYSLLSLSPLMAAAQAGDVPVRFSIKGEGHRFTPTWGLDMAWEDANNVKKGANHMGKENVGIGRSCFRFTKELTNDSVLASDQINHLRTRAKAFDQISKTLPIVLTADQEAVGPTDEDPNRKPPEYYVKNKVANIPHWAAMINSHVHWMQENSTHPVIGVSPFNEGDYWTVEEGATSTTQVNVAKLLKDAKKYPRMADVAIVGGNTLNDDKALAWYTSGKQYYDWGNTHQLAGTFDNFAKFYQQLEKDGKVGYGDEMHNVGEAMIGLEYGMTVGIWWGFDSRARGEFCDISRNGERLAYAEHRNNWTAASVYRHDDGRVKAFIGSSERQAKTTTYKFVSTDMPVFFDGYGPTKEYRIEIPGGTGYQTGQTNAERVIDITWGEDVQPYVIDGTYKVMNKATKSVMAAFGSADGNTNISQVKYTGQKNQQWNINPVDSRIGGDYSFYDFTVVSNGKHIDVLNYSLDNGGNCISYANKVASSNQQWYLEYVGDGFFHIRNRNSALYLTLESTSVANGTNIYQGTLLSGTAHDRQLWRIIPLDAECELEAPAAPEGLTATAQSDAVKLEWEANSEPDLAGYTVVRAERGTEEWNTIARQLTTTSFVDSDCEPGHEYLYKVKAIDKSANQSALSEAVAINPTQIRTATLKDRQPEGIYTLDGKQMKQLGKGVNIIRHGDGRTEKLIK